MLEQDLIPKQIKYDITLWGPYLWQSSLMPEVINQLTIRANNVRNLAEHNAEKHLAALMHDEWSYASDDIKWFAEVINPWIHVYLETYAHSIGKQGRTDLSSKRWNLDNLWVNFQRQYDFNPPHNHLGSLSFVTYLNVPNEFIVTPL